HLVSQDAVAVRPLDGGSSHVVRGRSVVLATGSRPRFLPGITPGERIVSSQEALQLSRVPSSAVVLGGGVIGSEFAGLWRSLGAQVTIVEALDRLLPGEDATISKQLGRAFTRRGITVRTGVRVAAAQETESSATVSLQDGTSLEADVLLVAVGREPVSDDIGLESAGVRTDGGFVAVDEQLRTSVPGIYAVGDLVPGLQLAHRGFALGIDRKSTSLNSSHVSITSAVFFLSNNI